MKYLISVILATFSLSAGATTVQCHGDGKMLQTTFSQDKSGKLQANVALNIDGQYQSFNEQMEIEVLILPKGEFLTKYETRTYIGRYLNGELQIVFVKVIAVDDSGKEVQVPLNLNNDFSVNARSVGRCIVKLM